MDTKKDFKFGRIAENYDEGFEGRASKKFYDLVTANTALNIHKVNGRVYTADEAADNFSSYGFARLYDKSDAYAQLICLKRI